VCDKYIGLSAEIRKTETLEKVPTAIGPHVKIGNDVLFEVFSARYGVGIQYDPLQWSSTSVQASLMDLTEYGEWKYAVTGVTLIALTDYCNRGGRRSLCCWHPSLATIRVE
jgi:hypothetical protein